jgi:hypothetical protein
MQADAQKALAHRDSLSLEEQYFAHATLAFAVDRQARLEMAAGAGK